MDAQITPASLNGISMSLGDRLEIIDDILRRKYLARLEDAPVAEPPTLPELESDIIDNVRMFRITEMVYQKGEPITRKLTTVLNTLSTYYATAFVVIKSDGATTDLYLGVRNAYAGDSNHKRSTVTLLDTLRQALIGHFPGIKTENVDRSQIIQLSKEIESLGNVSAVSVVGNSKTEDWDSNEKFVQGLEKLLLAMSGRSFIGMMVANSQPPYVVQEMRKFYQDWYTRLSPYQKVQLSHGSSSTTTKSKSFSEMDKKQKVALIASSGVSLAGVGIGAAVGTAAGGMAGTSVGAMLGAQVSGQLNGFINTLAPNEQIAQGTTDSVSSTIENKSVSVMLECLDQLLKKTNEYDKYLEY